MCELCGEVGYEEVMAGAGLPRPPLSAAGCCAVLAGHAGLRDRTPVTLRKRVEGAAEALSVLERSPDALGPDAVCAGHAALRGVLADCLKALRLPSLLGSGSRQFSSFLAAITVGRAGWWGGGVAGAARPVGCGAHHAFA